MNGDKKMSNTSEYLGDGVYLDDDGYQLWISVGHHENRVVALDKYTFDSLYDKGVIRFKSMMNGDKND